MLFIGISTAISSYYALYVGFSWQNVMPTHVSRETLVLNVKSIGPKTLQDRFISYFPPLGTNYPKSNFSFNIYESEKDYCAGISAKLTIQAILENHFIFQMSEKTPPFMAKRDVRQRRIYAKLPGVHAPPAEIRHE